MDGCSFSTPSPQSLFVLLLLLLAKGWAITNREVSNRTLIFVTWLIYAVVHSVLHTWKKVSG